MNRHFVLLALSTLIIVSCGGNQTSSPGLTPEINDVSPIVTVTDVPLSTPSIIPVPSGAIRVIPTKELSISYQWEALNITGLEEVLVVLPYEKYLIEDESITLDYLSWDGGRGELITLVYNGDQVVEDFSLFISTLPDSSNRLLISPLDFVYLSEIYILGTEEESIFGIEPSCDSQISYARDIALGAKYLAYRCVESRHLWNILSFDELDVIHTVNLMDHIEDFLAYEPKWINESTLVMEDLFHRGLCITRAPEWIVNCYAYPSWIGNASPTLRYFEVRADKYYMHPDELGFVSPDCILNRESCSAVLRPGWIPSGGDYILEDAAWLNDGQGLLYTVHVHSDESTVEPDETEYWHLNLRTMDVRRIGRYDGMFKFNIELTPSHPLWSPDGKWIVVTDGEDHYLLSIETGELKPFAEGGYILGPLDLSGATTQ